MLSKPDQFFVKDLNDINVDDFAEKELCVVLGLIYQGKKYAIKIRHDNSNESFDKIAILGDTVAAAIRITARKNKWVKD